MRLNNIVLDKDVCDAILKKNGYTSEEITVTYPLNSDYSNYSKEEFGEIKINVSYRGERPKWLDEKPLLNDVREYLTTDVLNNIVRDKIIEILLN